MADVRELTANVLTVAVLNVARLAAVTLEAASMAVDRMKGRADG